MLVVGVRVSQAPNDKLEIEPAIEIIKALLKDLGKVDTLVADTGYLSEKNVKHCHGQEVVSLIASKREFHYPSLLECFTDNRDMPQLDANGLVAWIQYDLQGNDGKEIYAKCKCMVEPTLRIIKNALGFRNSPCAG